jgi:hypothetical protein
MPPLRRFLPLALVLGFSCAIAQTPDTAILTGEVKDPSQAFVANAEITITNLLTGLHRTTRTNSQGKFVVTGLPAAGAYDVETVKDGFAPAHLQHISLAGGSTATVMVTLSISPANTVITTTGTATDVRTDEPQLGDRLSAQQIDETPLLNRRITFLPLLNAANRPAINQGDIFMNQNLFTTNGAGRRQAWFEVDGANGIDSWGRQTIFTNIPEAAVEEMTVLTNGFSAEYGASTGSVVNIVTKSGGDKLHGDLLELYRPSGPEAKLSGFNTSNATSGNDITNDTLAQSAASISGKLFKKDPTHFFFAGEFSQQNRASPVTSALDPGNFIGHYQDLLGFLRFDRQMSQSNNAFVRLSADGFSDSNPNGIVGGSTLPTVARTFHRKAYSGELGDTAVLTPKLVNNLRLQFQLASPITEFDPVVYGTQFVVPITGAATFTSGTSQSALLMNRQYEVSETLSASLGKHQLIAGGDWIFAHTGGNSKEFGGPVYLGSFTYTTCKQSVAICESPAYLNNIANVATYTQSYGNASYTVNDNLFAIFAQDDYHATQKLTLNLGLRYEQQTFTDSRANFGPRIGFVYDPRGTGETIVRGGFGIYYSQIVDNSEANYALVGPTGVFNYTASPGLVGFPTSIAAAPLPAFPSGAIAPLRSLYIRPGNSTYLNQFFPTSTLIGYPNKLLSPYSEQWTVSIEQRLFPSTILSIDYVGTHTVHVNRPLDVDPPTPYIRTSNTQALRSPQAANCTRPYWVAFFQKSGVNCATSVAAQQPPYSVIQSDVNDGYVHYNALDVNLKQNFGSKGVLLASYTWSHTIDNVDPDTTSQNPNDPNFTGAAEKGNAIYDQRNRLVFSGFYVAPLKIQIGGIATLAGGLPYNLVTGTTNSGDTGATTDRPVINGVVVGRNTGRGTPIYSVDPFLAREFPLFTERVRLNLRAEAFNVLNHANFVGFTNTYGNLATAPLNLGAPLAGITNQLPARQMQFSARIAF